MNRVLCEQLLALAKESAQRQLDAVRASPFAAGLDDEGVRRRADLQRWLRSGQEVSFRPNRSAPWERGVYLDMAGPQMALRVLVRRGGKEEIVAIDPAKTQVATRLERFQLRIEAQVKTLERELTRYEKRGEFLRRLLGQLKTELAGVKADIAKERTRVSALVPKAEGKEVRA